MLIKNIILDKIKAGEISLLFRRWKKPGVKAGGTQMTQRGVFGSIPGVLRVTAYGTSVHLNVLDPEAVRQEIDKRAKAEMITVSSIQLIDPSLEDVFATIAEGERE